MQCGNSDRKNKGVKYQKENLGKKTGRRYLGKKINLKSSTIFSTKSLKTQLTHLHGHIIQEIYEICVTIQEYYTNCIREMCQVYNGVQNS